MAHRGLKYPALGSIYPTPGAMFRLLTTRSTGQSSAMTRQEFRGVELEHNYLPASTCTRTYSISTILSVPLQRRPILSSATPTTGTRYSLFLLQEMTQRQPPPIRTSTF